MRILFFGDSITQGFWDTKGGWVQRLRTEYDQQTIKNLAGDAVEIFNLGISGDTTSGVARRLAYEVEARRWLNEPFGLVFEVGMNDTVFRGPERETTVEQYHDDLDVLLSAAHHYSDKILFIGLTGVDDELCNPWIYSSTGKCFSNDRILKFEEVLRKFCLQKKVPCAQILEKFQAKQREHNLLADGLHPNDLGHHLISDLAKPEFDKLLA